MNNVINKFDLKKLSPRDACLWKEWKEQIGETVGSIEHIRIEGGDGVGVKLNERGN